jgi:predicted nucleic-acid-binding protein
MNAIDTNILVRFLVGDDKIQTRKVYKIFKKAESVKRELFVPLLVIQELIWVLESVYDIARGDILDSISLFA